MLSDIMLFLCLSNVKASMVGYSTLIQKEVIVNSDRTVSLDFAMSVSSIEMEAIVVLAEKKVNREDVSATQEIVNAERIESMPVLRVDEFINNIKGIKLVSGAQSAGLSVRGEIRETDVRIDGISIQDPHSENSYLGFNSLALQEVQVLTGGFEVKYGNIRSGLLNVIAKEGVRERYTVSFKVNITHGGQKYFFGTNPWSSESLIYRVYSGEYAMGMSISNSLLPEELRNFTRWADSSSGGEADEGLDPLQKLRLWKLQHPQYSFGNKPDYYIEANITGPLLSVGIPLWEDYATGTYETRFSGADLTSGNYIVVLNSGNITKTTKVLLLK